MPLRHTGRAEVWIHSFLTSELDRVEWLAPVSIEQEAWWAPEPVWRSVGRRVMLLPPSGFDPPNRPARSVVAILTMKLTQKHFIYIYCVAIIIQQVATIYSFFLYICKLLYMFHQELISLYLQYLALLRPLLLPAWIRIQSCSREVSVTVSIMPDTVDTVIWADDDGWRYHPKHVEQFTDINCILLHLVG